MSATDARLERLAALEAALRGDPGHDVTGAVCAPTADRTKAVWNWERMGRALLAVTGPFEEGRCRVCGCTETTACSYRPVDNRAMTIPCAWVGGSDKTLCDNPECVEAARSVGLVPQPQSGWEPPPRMRSERAF